MVKWEYRTVRLSDNDQLAEELNHLGADGWELVFMADTPLKWLCVFKRPIP